MNTPLTGLYRYFDGVNGTFMFFKKFIQSLEYFFQQNTCCNIYFTDSRYLKTKTKRYYTHKLAKMNIKSEILLLKELSRDTYNLNQILLNLRRGYQLGLRHA